MRKNRLAMEGEIQSLGVYHPHHSARFDDFSNRILMIKDYPHIDIERKLNKWALNSIRAIEFFTNELHSILSEKDKYAICVVPSHKEGTAPSGIRTIARRLCRDPIIDATNVLIRTTKMQEKANGGSRDLSREIESLGVTDNSIINSQQVLLLDDVTTSGTSLKAGKYVLEHAGAELVAMFALGQTEGYGIQKGQNGMWEIK
jgi:predicted amidophosphoribosyltransferase